MNHPASTPARRSPALRSTLAALATTLTVLAAQAQTAPPGAPGGTPPGAPGGTTTPTLVGDSITITGYYPDLASAGLTTTLTVSDAVEVSCPDASQTLCNDSSGLLAGEWLDIGATSISGQFLASFSSAAGDSFNGWVFSGLDFGTGTSGITGLTLTTNIAGLTLDRLSYTADSLSINLLGLDPSVTTDGSGIGSFSIALAVSAVPEPGTLSLMAGGAGLLAFLGRRRRRTATR